MHQSVIFLKISPLIAQNHSPASYFGHLSLNKTTATTVPLSLSLSLSLSLQINLLYIRTKQAKMNCKTKPVNPAIPHVLSKKSKLIIRNATFSSSGNQKQQETTSLATHVEFKTLEGCSLGISNYPDFEYNAQGGGGSGTAEDITSDSSNELLVSFDLRTLYIPALTSTTTRFLGLPLPPFLRIDIVPELLEGRINQDSGKVDLEFKAKFLFSVGSIYRAPPLLVKTILTSGESKGAMRSGKGKSLDKAGKCTLVGVATVDPINDFLLNTFLGLPTECLANLNATISLSNSS